MELQTAAVCLSSNCLGAIQDRTMQSVVEHMKVVRTQNAHLQSVSDESLEWVGVLMLGLGMHADDVPMIPANALPREWIAVWGHWQRGIAVYQAEHKKSMDIRWRYGVVSWLAVLMGSLWLWLRELLL